MDIDLMITSFPKLLNATVTTLKLLSGINVRAVPVIEASIFFKGSTFSFIRQF